MQFEVREIFRVGKIDEKKNSNLYVLLDSNLDKFVSPGVKLSEQFTEGQKVEVVISLRVENTKIDVKGEGFKYFNVTKTFITDMKSVLK